MKKILVSACLLGEKVRYHGGDALVESGLFSRWQKEGRLISFCPEVGAGLPAPRPPSEITSSGGGQAVIGGSAEVTNRDGTDVTTLYLRGAQMAFALAKKHDIHLAILKDGSPSCGSLQIYDGTFTGTKTHGMGITAALLKANGIRVFTENELEKVLPYLD